MKATSTGFIMAPLVLRALAVLIDVAIVTVINLGVTAVLGDPRLEKASTLAVIMVTTAIYNLAFVITKSATPGKMAMNLYIAYPDASPIRPDTALLRYVVLFIGNLAIIDPMLLYVLSAFVIANICFVAFSRERRGIHDRIAGTIVLAGRPGAPLRIEDDIDRQGDRPRF